jgi:PDZ domain-containing protein
VVLLLVLGVVGTAVPVPYVAQQPGPTYNTIGDVAGEPLIAVTGRERNDVSGNLNLTTVGVSKPGLSLVEAVEGWFDDEISIVPQESVYPSDRSREETQRANRQAFLSSEERAEAVALGRLGYPEKVVVRGVSGEDSPSEGLLEENDAIESIDGQPTPDTAALDEVLGSVAGGSTVTVGFTRLGRPGTVEVTTAPATDREGALLGVLVADRPSAPFDVDVQVQDIGGPSAGLMLTLGILDLVGDTDLTEGAVIAGTGTIDEAGAVGPIGGIQLKMVAARDLGAELFLVPADNCDEALDAPQPGLELARVADVDDALDALADHRAGRTPEGC